MCQSDTLHGLCFLSQSTAKHETDQNTCEQLLWLARGDTDWYSPLSSWLTCWVQTKREDMRRDCQWRDRLCRWQWQQKRHRTSEWISVSSARLRPFDNTLTEVFQWRWRWRHHALMRLLCLDISFVSYNALPTSLATMMWLNNPKMIIGLHQSDRSKVTL